MVNQKQVTQWLTRSKKKDWLHYLNNWRRSNIDVRPASNSEKREAEWKLMKKQTLKTHLTADYMTTDRF